jgi:hypothetical protein
MLLHDCGDDDSTYPFSLMPFGVPVDTGATIGYALSPLGIGPCEFSAIEIYTAISESNVRLFPIGKNMIIGWAKGGGAGIVYPLVAGARTGTHAARYLILEIHLDNPEAITGKHINSGFKLYTTSTLSQVDVGTLVSVSLRP